MAAVASSASLQDDLIALVLRLDPVLGTYVGLGGEHDGWLPLASADDRAAVIVAAGRLAGELSAAVTEEAPTEEQIDARLAETGIRGLEIRHRALHSFDRDPDWYISTVVSGIHALLLRTDMAEEERNTHLLARLRAVPGFIDSARRQLHAPPPVLLENALGDTDGALHFLQDDLAEYLEGTASAGQRADLQSALQQSSQAVAEYRDILVSLAASSTEGFAIGEEAFNALLRDTHLVTWQASELLEFGLETTRALEQQLAELSQQCAGHEQWWLTIEPLYRRHPEAGSLLDAYRQLTEEARRFVEEARLVDLRAVQELELRDTPAFARTNLPFASYVPVPPLAREGHGELWITPLGPGMTAAQVELALQQHYLGRMLVIAAHEAYPGHHLQAAYATRASHPLRHVFASTMLVEGWALYCEDLMLRHGFRAADPDWSLLRLSQLSHALWRSLRVVLDVSLHCFGMSRTEAVGLLVSKHVLQPEAAAAEVMYYCSDPTQPLSYTLGKALLEDLVTRLSGEQSGADLSEIHGQILREGPLPFALLDQALGV